MNGVTKNINFEVRKQQLNEYIKQYNPYESKKADVNIHALVNYAKDNKIDLANIPEEIIKQFKI